MADETAPPEESAPVLPKPPRKRVRTPTLLQMEAVECGAAALGIILGYLRPDGSARRTARRVRRLARRIESEQRPQGGAQGTGSTRKGFKYDDLTKLYDLPLPVILFWNLNHFLVLEGFGGGKALSQRSGERADARHARGAELLGTRAWFSPSRPGRISRRAATGRACSARCAPGWPTRAWRCSYVMFCGLMLVLPGLVVPTFTRIFIDEYLVGNRTFMVPPLLMAMAITAIVLMVLTWLQKY